MPPSVPSLPRPNPFLASPAEASAVYMSFFTGGMQPPPAPGSGVTTPVVAPVEAKIRLATQGELFFPPEAIAAYAMMGYLPLMLEWLGPAMQSDSGQSTYAAVAPPQSQLYGKPVPMGFTYYCQYIGLMADMLAGLPEAHWYMLPDGSTKRQ